jgi:hypothetical protein
MSTLTDSDRGMRRAVIGLLGLTRATPLGEAVHFFFYDTPKVLLLLTGIVFLMGMVQTFFAPSAPVHCSPASGSASATCWPPASAS